MHRLRLVLQRQLFVSANVALVCPGCMFGFVACNSIASLVERIAIVSFCPFDHDSTTIEFVEELRPQVGVLCTFVTIAFPPLLSPPSSPSFRDCIDEVPRIGTEEYTHLFAYR